MSSLPLDPSPAPRKRTHPGRLRFFDGVAHAGALGGSLALILLLGVLFVAMVQGAYPSIKSLGLYFLYGSHWNPVTAKFGAGPIIYSTLVTSLIALLISVPVSIGSAVFLVKLAPKRPRFLIPSAGFLIELLAAIPSIAYGLWGIAVMVPFMQESVQPVLGNTLGNIPLIGRFFANPASGFNLLTAGIVLAIMVTPIITAVIRDVLAIAPPELEQGALGLGATWWQSMKLVLGFSKMGIFGAVILGFARAMGETMAVTMIIGNAKPNSLSLFSAGQTIASLLANQFNNADTDKEKQALIYAALVLLVITMLINGCARVILMRLARRAKK